AENPATAGSLVKILEDNHSPQSGSGDVPTPGRLPLPVPQLLVRPGTGIGEGGGPVDHLRSRLLHLQTGLEVAGGGREVQLDTAEGVDDPGEPAEIDLQVVVDADAGLPAHRLDEQLRPSEGVGRVDLVDSVAGDLHT